MKIEKIFGAEVGTYFFKLSGSFMGYSRDIVDIAYFVEENDTRF